ncbi:MAG: hypothetical protein AAGA23_11800 [Pseudomonadota bacterium]
MHPLTPFESCQVAGGRSENKGWIFVSPGTPDQPRYVVLPVRGIPHNPLPPPPPVAGPDL